MQRRTALSLLFLAALAGPAAAAGSAPAAAIATPVASKPTTRLLWHGHAAFQIITPRGKVLLIDPWLTNPGRPKLPMGAGAAVDQVKAMQKVDYIFITHGHFDHVGDAVALAKQTGARLVASFELGTNLARLQGYPAGQMGYDTLMNIGGEIAIADGEVTVAMVPAVHSSSLDPGPGKEKEPLEYGGNPAGFVLKIKDGPTIYHSGDTAFFRDMELIGESYAPDVALLNIGGHFGMEPAMAARAAEAVKARLVVPHHYRTFPILTQDPKGFFALLAEKNIPHREATYLQPLVFEGKTLKK